jgi:NAD-dependent histone deacetylase SIR2
MCQIVRDRREGTTIWINRDPIPPGKDLENLWDLVVKGDSDEVARLAALREWDNPDVELVDYTTADLERVKSSQGQIEIVIPPSPKKAEKNDQDKPVHRLLPSVEIQSMTPPRSQNGRSPRKSSEDTQTVSSSPVRIKLKVGERSKQAAAAQVKNPASTGRSIADVLGGKENSSKPDNKPKTSLNKKTKVTKIRASTNSQKPLTQQRISGKITKSTVSVEITQSYKKPAPEPLSPRRDSNETLIPPQKSGYSSVEVSPAPETPPSMGGEWRNGETISPTGRIPSDMVRLLN